MNLKLLGNRVAVEKNKKVDKRADHGLLIMPESEEFVGIIKFVGEEVKETLNLKAGQKVYFSRNHQAVRMLGSEYCVMEDKEVLAIVE